MNSLPPTYRMHSGELVRRVPAQPQQRGGITLIELLVVVAILGILLGITATVIRPLREGRDIREAARSVNAYLAAAQARAMHLQRPVGIWIRRFTDDPNDLRFNLALELYMAEVPPPYMGDDLSSYAMNDPNDPHTPNKIILTNVSGLKTDNDPSNENKHFNIRRFDYIRLNFKGPLYQIRTYPKVQGYNGILYLDRSITYLKNMRHVTEEPFQLPFQVYRYARPIQSIADPLQLPSSVAIDISMSGWGESDTFGSASDVAILFSPSGGIQYVLSGEPNNPPMRVPSAVHLLVGHSDKIGVDNLADGNNRWVSVGNLTGRMTTSEISPNPTVSLIDPVNQTAVAEAVDSARKFAVQGDTLGGG